jgi:Tfp pilus assembly protein PilO
MKSRDKMVLLGVLALGIALGFYVLVLSPKRDEASKLGTQVDDLEASISQQQQTADFGEQARHQFAHYYGRLVVLGKAVPEQADTSSMLVELSSIADHTGVDFRSVSLSQGSSGTGTSSAPPPTSGNSTATTADPSATAASSGTSTTSGSAPSTAASGDTSTTATAPSTATGTAASASTPVPATESAAATQPIGATVGPAGLPTLPYDLNFTGGFFDVANFIGGLDDLVQPLGATLVAANGRLLTVDGFALKVLGSGSNPKLTADFAVTSYVAPATQGLTAGASATGPAPVPTSPTQPDAQPASATVAQ